MPYLLKLRTILLCNYPYYILLVLVILISLPRLFIIKESNYSTSSTNLTGIIKSININDSNLKLIIKNKEKVLVYYYLPKDINYNNLELGDKIKVEGEFIKPQANTTENLFNYKRYLSTKNIHYIVKATSLTIISKNKNIFYKIKQNIKNRTNISPYLNAFILGDKSSLSQAAVTSFQENGISHLLAISGMHITLLSSIILKILKRLKIKENTRFFLTSLFLIIYLLLLDLTPSALRGVLFFILFSINKIYYFYIRPQNIFILVLIITLLINPFFIYDIGFQYSFIISLTLILTSSMITGNYLLKLLKTSTISILVSLPISLYNYYQINILSIVYNLFYVPFVSFIIFPLSILTIIIKPLLPIYNLLILVLETTSLFLSKISLGKLIFGKINIIIYLIYYYLIIKILLNIKKSHKPILILFIFLIIHYNYPSIKNISYITMIDVGQGDSILLHSKNESILIDTGGSIYSNNSSSKIALPTIIPLLKSKGIRKIKYLILTHGDADHMQEAKFLLDYLKVEKVIINQGHINYLEEELIKRYNNIYMSKQNEILTCGDITLQQLNKDLSEENDSSQVYYGTYKEISMLFTGDASTKTEKFLLTNYDLGQIDLLKIGHHGSTTSSSKEFIESINPNVCLISVGKDNKFGHPKESVLNTLRNCNVYRTDLNGSVDITLTTKKLNIETKNLRRYK